MGYAKAVSFGIWQRATFCLALISWLSGVPRVLGCGFDYIARRDEMLYEDCTSFS